MKFKSILLFVFCALSLVFSFPLYGQVSDKEKAEQEQKKNQEVEKKTYILVDEITGAALSLKLPENRSFILAAAADLFWAHNEPRARNLFWDALNAINLVNNTGNASALLASNKDPRKLSEKEKQEQLQQYYQVFSLRQDLLQRVARHDPQLALDMLRSSRQVAIETPAGFPVLDDRDLEQRIAAEVTARDPQRAYQLAHESLAKGLSFQLFDLLFRLNQKDQKLASKFAGEIIEKLSTRNLTTDPNGTRIAISLLNISREAPDRVPRNGAPITLRLDDEQKRALVNLITDAAQEETADINLLYDLGGLMPEIEQFAPERIAALQRKLAAPKQTQKQQTLSLGYTDISRAHSPEEMLKLANGSSDEERQWIQQQAIGLAVMRRRADSLREFINNEISDQGRRKELLDQLDAHQLEFTTYKGDADGLRKLLPQIRLRERRARAMAELAILLEKKGEHDEALKLLDEAQTMIKSDLNSETQSNALLSLIAAYAFVEPNRAFAIIERTIDQANDEVGRALFWDKIVKTGAVKKGELRLSQSGMVPIDFALFKYGDAVSALARVDFDRTKAAADRFQRYELRLMARLLLAQALLRPVPEKPTADPSTE